MSMLVLCIYICSIKLLYGLNIVNITSPINLTKTFVDSPSVIETLRSGTITYYIDPNDNTNTKYLWFGEYDSVNSSQMFTHVKSDIFTPEWNQYNNLNNVLPFTLTETPSISNDSVWERRFGPNIMCTSPTTKDIFSCWLNISYNISDSSGIDTIANIQCKIYFVKENKWSSIIHVTSSNIQHLMLNVLCFDDSYFIPILQINLHTYNPLQFERCYGVLLDLNGNIAHNETELNCPKYPQSLITGWIYTLEGADIFSINNNKSITSTFMINAEAAHFYQNSTTIEAIYGYYTNINDTNPISIYNTTTINRKALNGEWDEIDLGQGAAIKIKNDCCYISLYSKYINMGNSRKVNIYAMITDVYGNAINVTETANDTDILLVQNGTAASIITPQIIDLSSIYKNYFIFVYAVGRDPYNSDTIMCNVYYLEYDANDNVYSIQNAGGFETVKIIPGYYESFSGVSAYMFPDSNNNGKNNLFISWSQRTYNGLDDGLWAQTFSIS